MKKILLSLLVLSIVLAVVVWIRYGGGEPYPNLTATPLFPDADLLC